MRTLLRRGPKFDVELLSTTASDGSTITREALRHPGSVIVLALLEAPGAHAPPEVVLIENFRLTLERAILELPAGTRDPGEDPLVCARRELREETGFEASRWRPLGSFLTAPGLTDELMHAFVATGLTRHAQSLELDEDIRVTPVPIAHALAMASDGRITDAKTMLVLLLAQRAGLLDGPSRDSQ